MMCLLLCNILLVFMDVWVFVKVVDKMFVINNIEINVFFILKFLYGVWNVWIEKLWELIWCGLFILFIGIIKFSFGVLFFVFG